MEDTPPLVADLAAHDLGLLQDVGDRAAEGGDPSLVALQQQIRTRRAKRSAHGLTALVAATPEAAAALGRAPGDHTADLGVGSTAARPTVVPADDADVTTTAVASPTLTAAPGRVAAIESLGRTVRILRIGRPAGFSFRPGQYLKLGVPGGKREDFSIASPPHQALLDLAIELRPGGKVTPALFALGVGAAVDIGGAAKGKLQLDADADHHLMVATSTGIAPLRSMLLDALHRGTRASFTVLVGASYTTELPFHAELTALAAADQRVSYHPTISRPDEPTNRSWSGAKGRVDPLASMAASHLEARTTHVYAVGNAGMITNVVRELGGAGFRISTESYGG